MVSHIPLVDLTHLMLKIVLATTGTNKLLPGQYPSNIISSLSLTKDITPSLNGSVISSGGSVSIAPSQDPLFFAQTKYLGDQGFLSNWQSAWFPQDYYGLVSPGVALWNSIPDSSEIVWVSTSLIKVASCSLVQRD
jgi:hypothetical protein